MKKNDLILVACAVASIIFLMYSEAVFAKTPSRHDIKIMVVDEAQNSIVPPEIALAVAKVESNFNPSALSSAGARGVMQIMPRTARDVFGVRKAELWDARLNIQLGIDYLAQLYDQYGGRWDLALSHYNGGTLRGKGKYAKPHSYTRKYVKSVMSWRQKYAQHAILWQDGSNQGRLARLGKLDFQREKLSEKLKFNVAKLSHLRRDIQGTEGSDRARFGQHEKAYMGWRHLGPGRSKVRTTWELGENSNDVAFDAGFEARLHRARETLDDFAHLARRDKT